MADYSLPIPPVPLENMTRDSLRMFIPHLISQVEGKSKIKLGTESDKPPWWPEEVPWSSIRLDTREEQYRKKRSWSDALRDIVRRCYRYYGNESLLVTSSSRSDNSIKVINNMDGSLSYISESMIVNIDQATKSKKLNGVAGEPDSPVEGSDVPVPSRVFQNLQGLALSTRASIELIQCHLCKCKFNDITALQRHHLKCSQKPKKFIPKPFKLKLTPVDELPRDDKKRFIEGLCLVPMSKARIMKKQQTVCKAIEIISLDSDDEAPTAPIVSPTTPKTPRSLISQLSRDLSPPGKGRRRSLRAAFQLDEESETESVKSEKQTVEEGEETKLTGSRSVLNIDLCSSLGERVKKLMQQQAEQAISAVITHQTPEQFCHTPKKNQGLGRLRHRPNENQVVFKKTRKTCPKYAHQYKFTSSQRREWFLTSKSGLNARARGLRKLLKKCYVKIQRLSASELKKWEERSRYAAVRSHWPNQHLAYDQYNQNYLTGQILTGPTGQQFLVPNQNLSPQQMAMLNSNAQQRMWLSKFGAGNNNVIDLTPPATPEEPRPVHLVKHGQEHSEIHKLLQRPLKRRLESEQPNRNKATNDVICLSSSEDESESSRSKPPPKKRQKVEPKQKAKPTLLFKCHLCHEELACHGNFSSYIEGHFASKHKVTNIQLIEHVDARGNKVVSIVEKVQRKKNGTNVVKPRNSFNSSRKQSSSPSRNRKSDVICID